MTYKGFIIQEMRSRVDQTENALELRQALFMFYSYIIPFAVHISQGLPSEQMRRGL